MPVLSGLLTCSTGRVRTEEVSLCSASFSPTRQGGSVHKPTISPITGPSQHSFFSPLFFWICFYFGKLPFLCTNGTKCFCYAAPVETCERLNLRLHSSRCVSTDCLSQFFTQGRGRHQHSTLICSKCPKSDVPILDICVRMHFLKSIKESLNLFHSVIDFSWEKVENLS